jgi:hypothetical protein
MVRLAGRQDSSAASTGWKSNLGTAIGYVNDCWTYVCGSGGWRSNLVLEKALLHRAKGRFRLEIQPEHR